MQSVMILWGEFAKTTSRFHFFILCGHARFYTTSEIISLDFLSLRNFPL